MLRNRRIGERRFQGMQPLRILGLVFLLAAGCTASDPNANDSIEGQRGPLADPTSNTMNSPTTGASSAGLSGGTVSGDPADLSRAPGPNNTAR